MQEANKNKDKLNLALTGKTRSDKFTIGEISKRYDVICRKFEEVRESLQVEVDREYQANRHLSN